MSYPSIEFLVEEPSLEVLLYELSPQLLRGLPFVIRTFQCKDDLLKQLPQRLRGYVGRPVTDRAIVIVDRDDDDCYRLKQTLEHCVSAAGLATRTQPRYAQMTVINRIAIEELEAWYFGDWAAVRAAYPRVPETIPAKASYRDPDAIVGGTWEALERILQRAGYFKGGLRKIEIARTIAPHMDPARNTSHSFQILCQTLQNLVTATPIASRPRT